MGLFETFEKVSHQEWVDKINTDLKGKDYQETLVWASEEGIDIQPFYNDAVEVGNTPLKTTAAWKINETVVVEDIETANRQALEALKGGANSILFIGEINTPSDMDALLKDIQTAIVELHFYAPNPKEVSSFIALAQGSISYDLIDNKTASWLNDLATLTQSDAKFKTITVQLLRAKHPVTGVAQTGNDISDII